MPGVGEKVFKPQQYLWKALTDRGQAKFTKIFASHLMTTFKGTVRQIGSPWVWYHWIGLKKDINRLMFLIFKFWSWIFERSSKLWAVSYKKWIQPPTFWDHGLFRILSSYWLLPFYLLKKSAKVMLIVGFDCGLLVFFKYICAADFSLLNLPKKKSLGRSKPATNS